MKNPDPAAIVTAALEKVEALQAEIPQLKTLADKTTATLAELELRADLADVKAMSEIGRQQILAGLLPRRIASREADLEAGSESLLAACHSFVVSELGPISRKLTECAQKKLQKELRPHFSEDWQLAQAVEASNLMTSLVAMQGNVTLKQTLTTINEFKRYARELVQAWSDLAKFEKENLS